MKRLVSKSLLTFLTLACCLGVASSAAQAQLKLEIEPGLEQLPLDRWTSEAKVDLPDVLVRVKRGVCPGSAGAVACTGGFTQGGHDVTFNLARLDEFGIGFYRGTWFHELGHVVDMAYFGRQVREDLALALGYPAGRGWNEDKKHDPANGVIGPAPEEWFANAYSNCAWGPGGRDETKSYGFPYVYSQITGICQVVHDHVSGTKFRVESLPPFPTPCVKRCRVTLGPRVRFVSNARFAPGSIRVAFPRFNRTLSRAVCGRVIKLRRQRVRINSCGQRLVAKVLSFGKVRMQLWGSARQRPASPPPLPISSGGRSTVKVENPSAGNLPLQSWIDQAAIPTPRTEFRTTYGACVSKYLIVCVNSPFGQRFHFLWVDLEKLGQVGFESTNYRAWLYREVGKVAADAFLGARLKREVTVLLGYAPNRGWDVRNASAATVAAPAQFFAEAYATCAWGGNRPSSSVSPETPHSFASVSPVCELIKRIV